MIGRPRLGNSDLPQRLQLRISKSGRKHFYYRLRDGRKIALGSDRAVALERWAQIEARGALLAHDAMPSVIERYRREVLPTKKPKTQEQYESALGRLEEAFLAARLSQIKPLHVRQYLDRRSAKTAANREIAVLSAMFNWAREKGITEAANPCAGVSRNRESGRDIYVTDEVLRVVRAEACPELVDAIDLALLTGQRAADVLKFRRTMISDGHLWHRQNKTGTKQGIEIVPGSEFEKVLKRALERPRDATSLWMVQTSSGQPLTVQTLQRRFQVARAAAAAKHPALAEQIRAFQFRDLRPKAATDSGDLRSAQELLGHSDETTTARIYRRVRGTKVKPLR
jgi:integrase